ncbi:MAG: TspO/MBR family protein [Planctomycetia bacterium]|nr:TspO/MBR family protein [Planctomycetia bacterium]
MDENLHKDSAPTTNFPADAPAENTGDSVTTNGKGFMRNLYEKAGEHAENISNNLRDAVIADGMRPYDDADGCPCCHSLHRGHGDCVCREIFAWAGFVFIPLTASWISGLFIQQESSMEWFKSLNHLMYEPPQWIYLPVWLVLNFLLGTSVWLTWKKLGCRKGAGILMLFGFLLLLQISWSYTFFYSHNLFGGFINLIWIFAVFLLLGLATAPVCRLATALLVPQAIWLIYALILNYQLWRIN